MRPDDIEITVLMAKSFDFTASGLCRLERNREESSVLTIEIPRRCIDRRKFEVNSPLMFITDRDEKLRHTITFKFSPNAQKKKEPRLLKHRDSGCNEDPAWKQKNFLRRDSANSEQFVTERVQQGIHKLVFPISRRHCRCETKTEGWTIHVKEDKWEEARQKKRNSRHCCGEEHSRVSNG